MGVRRDVIGRFNHGALGEYIYGRLHYTVKPMPSHSSTISQELRRLDVSSLDFQDRLNDALSGKQFMERAVGLARNDLMWIIGYLDEVRYSFSLPYSRSRQRRL